MTFDVYTQDGFRYKGEKDFETIEDLMEFVKMHENFGGITIQGNDILIMNVGEKDLF